VLLNQNTVFIKQIDCLSYVQSGRVKDATGAQLGVFDDRGPATKEEAQNLFKENRALELPFFGFTNEKKNAEGLLTSLF